MGEPTVLQLFEDQVSRTPEAIAVVSGDTSLTFVNEAAAVVQQGTADAATVDRVFQESFAHRMGPLRRI